MDATYKTSNRLLPLITIMAIDGEGHGKPVFHAFVKHENKHILSSLLTDFQRSYQSNDTYLILIDKDFSEIAALKDNFPDSKINLCAFHVSRAIQRGLTRMDVGKEVASEVLDLFMRQVYEDSKEEFLRIQEKITALIPRSSLEYFQKWWRDAEMWASSYNKDICNLGIKTTNHVESYHQKIKKFLSQTVTLPQAMKNIMQYDKQDMTGFYDRELMEKGTRQYYTVVDDPHDEFIANHVTQYAADLIRKQVRLATLNEYEIHVTSPGFYDVSSGTSCYTANFTQCECSFFRGFALPCRHIVAVRKHCSLPSADLTTVNPRFLKRRVNIDEAPPETCRMRRSTKNSALTLEGKYARSKDILTSISSFICLLGETEFERKCRDLESLLDGWKKGKDVAIMVSVLMGICLLILTACSFQQEIYIIALQDHEHLFAVPSLKVASVPSVSYLLLTGLSRNHILIEVRPYSLVCSMEVSLRT
jgi:hypothetical protein